MQIKDLAPNAKNPRKMSVKRKDALKKSLDKFGDLSGFVYNRRSRTLVSGHQRQSVIPKDAQIKIEHKYEAPTRARTVAEGHVLIDGEKFKYREVDADPKWEAEALLAANKHSGEWDRDLLRVVIADIDDIEVTGFDIPELKMMNINIEPIVIDDEPTDEEYVRDNPGPDSTLQKENISDAKSAFQSIEETREVINKRFVLIIDCTSQDAKDKLKQEIKTLVETSGAKFF